MSRATPSDTSLEDRKRKLTWITKGQVYALKKQFQSLDIFLYQCGDLEKCNCLIALHHPRCKVCGTQNIYYDESLKVDETNELFLEASIMKSNFEILKNKAELQTRKDIGLVRTWVLRTDD